MPKTLSSIYWFQAQIKKNADKVVDPPQFHIRDSQVENVDQTKYLGVTIDKNLSWAEHISNVGTKVSHGIEF